MCNEQWGADGFNFSAQEKLGEKERHTHTHTLRALRAHTRMADTLVLPPPQSLCLFEPQFLHLRGEDWTWVT